MKRNNKNGILQAVLHSAAPPTDVQRQRFANFLARTYGRKVSLVWEEDPSISKGFVLQAGSVVYDWSLEGHLRQLRGQLEKLERENCNEDNLLPLMREAMEGWVPSVVPEELGHVLTVGDEIATVDGLEHAQYGEILLFEGGVKGMVQDLRRDTVGCVLFDGGDEVAAGSVVRRTGRTAGMPVGEGFLGRVVDALGVPIDGKGDIRAEGYRPIEAAAPAILDRQPVNTPMETGLLAIDAMFPIGRGQRELIIGDRQTGKTVIATDTIINQKGTGVICIYVAIGQKQSTVAQLVNTLEENGAMDYTIVVSASASELSPLQYIAPYAGCAMGEYFMAQGRDVLVIYDDLSKHAVAYRALSLLIRRPPGREAYPGDVFYLHSRLLERAARIAPEYGGGSLTALPIIETQAGDVSAYIPTNVISITDGQLFLESSLFFAGQRPAVNVGLSVSRVGGSAQRAAIRQISGQLRVNLAQYRELAIFMQFGSDLDAETQKTLSRGAKMTDTLKQRQYLNYSVKEMIVLLAVSQSDLVDKIPERKMSAFVEGLLDYLHINYAALLDSIDPDKKLPDSQKEEIFRAAEEYIDCSLGEENTQKNAEAEEQDSSEN